MNEMMVNRPRPTLERFQFVKEVIGTIAFVVAAFTLLQLALPRSVVNGRSMQPTLVDGERLVISRMNYLFGEPQYGDIVVFNSPRPRTPDESSLVKRIIGKPGDTIEIRDLQVYVNGVPLVEPYIREPCDTSHCRDNIWELGENEYFVMGDNRNNSNDSRSFGPVPRENVVGEALIRYWPLERIGIIHRDRFVD